MRAPIILQSRINVGEKKPCHEKVRWIVPLEYKIPTAPQGKARNRQCAAAFVLQLSVSILGLMTAAYLVINCPCVPTTIPYPALDYPAHIPDLADIEVANNVELTNSERLVRYYIHRFRMERRREQHALAREQHRRARDTFWFNILTNVPELATVPEQPSLPLQPPT